MHITTHHKNNLQIAELFGDEVLISNIEDGTQLLADLYYQDFDLVMIQAGQLDPSFFDLKSCLAKQLLQKCSN